ncbi:sulfotransferase [Pseudomonadota bacterium]
MQLAVQHHGAGNLPQASALYQQILQSDPRQPDALHLLGVLAYQQGALDNAVDLITKSLRFNAKNPDAHYNLAKAHKDLGNLPAAIDSYRKALAIRPDVDTHFNIANAHKGLGQWAEAADAYRAAIALKPDYAEAHNSLGLMEHELDNIDAAIASYRKAIEINPGLAEAHYSLADVLEKTHRIDELREVVSAAKQHCPDQPLVVMAEALVLKRDKDFARARACLEAIDAAEVSPSIAAKRNNLLGGICDRLDDAPAAFGYFRAANRHAQELAPTRDVHPERFGARVTAHGDCFSPDWVKEWQAFKPEDGRADPVFLVGFPRSGTTLLDTILRSHPDVAVAEEIDAVANAYTTLRLRADRGLDDLAGVKRTKHLAAFRKAYFAEIDQHLDADEGAKVLIDKMPLNAVYAGMIKRAFPNARFLLALRHPCDCVLSCFMQDFALNDAMANFLDIEDAAQLYDQVMTLWQQYCDVLDLDVHHVRYEDLVVDMEGEISPLLAFLGLEWDDAVRDYAATAKKRTRINTPSYNQVTEKLYTRASGRWVKYREDLKPVLPMLLPWAEKFGYDA